MFYIKNMKLKELKEYLEYIDDDIDIFVSVGGRKVELETIDFEIPNQIIFSCKKYNTDSAINNAIEIVKCINSKNEQRNTY